MKPHQRLFARRRIGRLSRRWLVALLALFLALIPLTAVAAEMVTGDDVVITAPVADDVYAFGAQVTIDADIDGDVIASAAEIQINGNVTGSVYLAAFSIVIRGNVGGVVMATGSDVTILGDVGDTVRVAASDLEIEGSTIGGDLVAAASDIDLDDASRVGGEVVVRGSNVVLEGDVAGEIRGRADSLEIGGEVGGPIDVHVGTLRFVDGARVTQPVSYTSDREVLVDGGTIVTGELTRLEPDHQTLGERILSSAVWAVFRFLWAFALGLFLLRVAPQLLHRTADVVRRRPFPSLGWGLIGIIGIPLTIVFLMVSVIGLPVALVVLAGFVVALYASQIVLALIIGSSIAPQAWRESERLKHAAGVLAIGLFIVVAVRALPIPGWYFITGAATAMIAIGALLIQIFKRDVSDASDQRGAPA